VRFITFVPPKRRDKSMMNDKLKVNTSIVTIRVFEFLEIEQNDVEGNWEEGESNIGLVLLGCKSNNSRTGVVRIGKIYYLII
jgi:hypothetical protein